MGKTGCALLVALFLVLLFFSSLSVLFTEGNPFGLVFAGIIGYVIYVLIIKPISEGVKENKEKENRPPTSNRSSYKSGGRSACSSDSGKNYSADKDDVFEFMIMDDLTDGRDDD